MRDVFGSRKRRDAQTLVFFLLAWGTIMLLCGLAIDSGLLFLAKARLGRAVDGAALAAVGNFNRNSDPPTNRDEVALIMRNFAAANFTDLSSISTTGSGTTGGTGTPYTLPNGTTGETYTYSFNDGTQDANSQYRRFVQVVLTTGSGGAITSATCNARCPVQTYFIGYATYAINGRQNVKIGGYSGPSSLVDLKVSSTAVATRNPRLIMVVIDRSASMLQPGGGASGLPPAVVQFLDFFDTSSDYIGIVSFGSNARLEMPLTTNFIYAGTNNLIDAYNTNDFGGGIPGIDPEESSDPNYATTGIRRLKFGGDTAADEGIRLGLEQLMANSGFNDPDVIKYMVIFTDGKWNACRTLFAAPGYTNEMTIPALGSGIGYVTNGYAKKDNMTNGQSTSGHDGNGVWSTNLIYDTNLAVMPSLGLMSSQSSISTLTNAIANLNLDPNDHTNDVWQSQDSSGYEPLGNPNGSLNPGVPMAVTNMTWVGTNAAGTTNYYTHDVDVWLQPGSVAYYYTNAAAVAAGVPTKAYVSNYNNNDQHIYLKLFTGGKIDLVVPGYVVDGIFYDGLDLTWTDTSSLPRYRDNNYQEAYMWDDETATYVEPFVSNSLHRQLMFRNYPNLLTGYYLFRPDDPLSTATEPLDDTTPATYRPLNGNGPYYPSAAFYWPFDLVGVDYDATYGLINPLSDPDPLNNQGNYGGSRHIAYSINMLSDPADPEWSGELFYKSISGSGINVVSGTGTTSASQIMVSSDWQNGAPGWLTGDFQSDMTNEAAHNTNISPNPSVWRPATYNGSGVAGNQLSGIGAVSPSDSLNNTGGYVTDGNGNYYRNAMAWSGRPTHYFDFSQSQWIPIANNHVTNIQALPMGNWKAQEYAWHARALGVTIYTVGYGQLVTDAQQAFLAQIANSTNTTAGGGSNITYNPNQPIGQQFYATNAAQISNDFYSVGQAINAALTQ